MKYSTKYHIFPATYHIIYRGECNDLLLLVSRGRLAGSWPGEWWRPSGTTHSPSLPSRPWQSPLKETPVGQQTKMTSRQINRAPCTVLYSLYCTEILTETMSRNFQNFSLMHLTRLKTPEYQAKMVFLFISHSRRYSRKIRFRTD